MDKYKEVMKNNLKKKTKKQSLCVLDQGFLRIIFAINTVSQAHQVQ